MAEPTSKRYYRIAEVSALTDTPLSTLRFWEKHFPQLSPQRSPKGTRYYTPRDIENVRMIKYLVHTRGMRIEAALEQLRTDRDGVRRKAEALMQLARVRDRLQQLIDSLHHLR